MDHIDAMDQLKNGIGLRALGNQDPAVAYATEGMGMYEEMISDIREEIVRYCFNVSVTTSTQRKSVVKTTKSTKEDYEDEDTKAARLERNSARKLSKKGDMSGAPAAAPKANKTGKQETVRRDMPKVGRNDPCPCGSGKKYKNCCGRNL